MRRDGPASTRAPNSCHVLAPSAASKLRRGMRQKSRILVETDDAAGRADALAHEAGDAARPAAEVEARPSRRNADEVEHRARLGRQRGGLDVQAFDLALAGLDRIMAGEGGGHGSGPSSGGGRSRP